LAQIYEAMFLLDNQVVREDWGKAKAIVTKTLEKHGGTILTARRWDERKLAYMIEGNRRATFLLVHHEIPGDAIPAMQRDFNLNETVLRYLSLAVDVVPEEEQALSEAENAEDFTIPTPPPDDAPDEEEPREDVDEDSLRGRSRGSAGERSANSKEPDKEPDEEPAAGAEAPATSDTASPESSGTTTGTESAAAGTETATEPANAGSDTATEPANESSGTEPVGAVDETKDGDGADGSKEL